VVHVENVSANASGGRALLYSLRSRTLYASRHWPAWQSTVLTAFTLMVEIPLRLLASVRGPERAFANTWRASREYYRFVRARSGNPRRDLVG